MDEWIDDEKEMEKTPFVSFFIPFERYWITSYEEGGTAGLRTAGLQRRSLSGCLGGGLESETSKCEVPSKTSLKRCGTLAKAALYQSTLEVERQVG